MLNTRTIWELNGLLAADRLIIELFQPLHSKTRIHCLQQADTVTDQVNRARNCATLVSQEM